MVEPEVTSSQDGVIRIYGTGTSMAEPEPEVEPEPVWRTGTGNQDGDDHIYGTPRWRKPSRRSVRHDGRRRNDWERSAGPVLTVPRRAALPIGLGQYVTRARVTPVAVT